MSTQKNTNNLVKIHSDALFPFIEQLLEDCKNVEITVIGNSMYSRST